MSVDFGIYVIQSALWLQVMHLSSLFKWGRDFISWFKSRSISEEFVLINLFFIKFLFNLRPSSYLASSSISLLPWVEHKLLKILVLFLSPQNWRHPVYYSSESPRNLETKSLDNSNLSAVIFRVNCIFFIAEYSLCCLFC